MDGTSSTQSEPRWIWIPNGEGLSDPRPRSALYGGVREDSGGSRRKERQVAAAFAEPECSRGTIRSDDQGVLSGAADPVRGRVSAESDSRIHRPLSFGTKPP